MRGVEFFGLDGFEVFLRGEVDNDVVFGALQCAVEPFGDDVAPKFVEIFCARLARRCPFLGGRAALNPAGAGCRIALIGCGRGCGCS